jgi:KDO2-lipid IV(A) lauroyltransferase
MLFLLRLVARLPLRLLHAVGVGVGWIVYLLSPRYRRVLRSNLDAAGLSGLRSAVIGECGKAALELPAIWLRPHAHAVERVVEVHGWEHVEVAARLGKGLMIVTPHLGCWEMVGQYVSSRIPMTAMYSPPKLRSFESLMRVGRERGGAMTSVPADLRGVRAMLKALKRGEAIGLLPDQVPGTGEGEWVEFFGRPAYTMTLVGRLVQQTGVPVLLCSAERLPRGGGYRFSAEPWVASGAAESPARALNRSLEQMIRRCPQQYLWSYNRYKVPAGASPPAR